MKKEKNLHILNKILITFLSILIIGTGVVVYATGFWYRGYKIDTTWDITARINGEGSISPNVVAMINEWGYLSTIDEMSCSNNVFVPTKTRDEFMSRLEHNPSCYTIIMVK